MKCCISILLIVLACFCAQGQSNVSDTYNITWKSQSKNSSESMPCGGGDVGLNVWVEDGDLFIYVARSGTFDENNALLKLGRLRVKLSPNPFTGSDFEQTLLLHDGYVKIKAKKENQVTELDIWADVFQPIVHVDISSNLPVSSEVHYESWRHQDRTLHGRENQGNSYKWAPQGEVKTHKDEIRFSGDDIIFYHRNKEATVFDVTVKQQGLDSVKHKLYNPLARLTFGGLLRAKGMKPDGTGEGTYNGIPFRSWKLKTVKAQRKHNVTLFLHSDQANKAEDWESGLNEQVKINRDSKSARTQTLNWWHQFWNRSFIYIQPDKADEADPRWQAGRNYQLFRYMLACNAQGNSPTKFNGGLFTYDPVFTDSTLNYTPDFRNWGGGIMTAQNQRLVYYPMIKSGDVDLLKSQLQFYLSILRNAEIRSEVYWKHPGACFTEQMENFGLPNAAEYNWDRPADFDKGVEYNAWLEYEWDTVLEFCLMMLDTERYFEKDITEYIPFIESCLTFFDEHYQYLARKRGRNTLDGNGDLILYPGSATETYKMANNATSTIAALQATLERMVALPPKFLSEEKRKKWSAMLERIPPITITEANGHKQIAPARSWERVNNEESPQLYPVFPWGIYSVGKPSLNVALNTWKYDSNVVKFRSHKGWKQDNIFAARLGLTNEAAELTVLKLKDSGRRFPAFWGPGFDWTPDHNWGGSGMIGLQEMLLQSVGDTLYLFPAWPKEWDVHFKLHAPGNTIIEARVKKGVAEVVRIFPEVRRKDVVVCVMKSAVKSSQER